VSIAGEKMTAHTQSSSSYTILLLIRPLIEQNCFEKCERSFGRRGGRKGIVEFDDEKMVE
jgi:hypothetical protein